MTGRELFELMYSLPAGVWVFIGLAGVVLYGSLDTFVRIFHKPGQEVEGRTARLARLLGLKTTSGESPDPSYRQSADIVDMAAAKRRMNELEQWNMAFAEQLVNQAHDLNWLIRRLQYMAVLITINTFLMMIILATIKEWLR